MINNAALWRSYEEFTETSTEKWRRYLDVNVMGVVHFTKAAFPGMLEYEILSVYGKDGMGDADLIHPTKTPESMYAVDFILQTVAALDMISPLPLTTIMYPLQPLHAMICLKRGSLRR